MVWTVIIAAPFQIGQVLKEPPELLLPRHLLRSCKAMLVLGMRLLEPGAVVEKHFSWLLFLSIPCELTLYCFVTYSPDDNSYTARRS